MKDILLEILTSFHPEIDFLTAKQLISQGILDSFDIVALIGEIDDQLGVRIPAACIVPESFESLETLNSLIVELKNRG